MEVLREVPFVADQQLIRAKVPILRIQFNGRYSEFTVDINVNNAVAIRNTHLLYYYSGCKLPVDIGSVELKILVHFQLTSEFDLL